MNYLNNNKLISLILPIEDMNVSTDLFGKMRVIVTMESKDFEKLETEYRGLFQDRVKELDEHNYQECENPSCSIQVCLEFREHQHHKYILER